MGEERKGGRAEDDNVPIAEMNKLHRLPNVSTRKKTKMAVETTLTIPYIPDARSEFDVPVYPIYETKPNTKVELVHV